MSRNTWIAVVISIIVIGFFLFGGTLVSMFTAPDQLLGQPGVMNETTQSNSMDTINQGGNADGLTIQDVVVGTGDEAMTGDLVTVNYVGMFENGKKFDASADHGQPFQFPLGQGTVIKGWDFGVVGMKVGGKRILKVDPSMGYGSQQVGPIPPNSTLVFEVELLKVEKGQ